MQYTDWVFLHISIANKFDSPLLLRKIIRRRSLRQFSNKLEIENLNSNLKMET